MTQALSPPQSFFLGLHHKIRSHISSYFDVSTFVRLHITCCHTFDHFAIECGCGCEQHCQHATFESICQTYHESHFRNARAPRSWFGWIDVVKEQLLLPQIAEECFQGANYTPLQEWLSDHEATITSAVSQRLLITSILNILRQNPVQAASRRAFIFTMLLKRLQTASMQNDLSKLTLLAEEGRHKHFVRLLKKKRASVGEAKPRPRGCSQQQQTGNANGVTLQQLSTAFDDVNADSSTSTKENKVYSTSNSNSSSLVYGIVTTSPIKKLKTGKYTSSPVAEGSHGHEQGQVLQGQGPNTCSSSTSACSTCSPGCASISSSTSTSTRSTCSNGSSLSDALSPQSVRSDEGEDTDTDIETDTDIYTYGSAVYLLGDASNSNNKRTYAPCDAAATGCASSISNGDLHASLATTGSARGSRKDLHAATNINTLLHAAGGLLPTREILWAQRGSPRRL